MLIIRHILCQETLYVMRASGIFLNQLIDIEVGCCEKVRMRIP